MATRKDKRFFYVEAMDKMNDRYGEFSITYGCLMHCQKHAQIISHSYRPTGCHQVE